MLTQLKILFGTEIRFLRRPTIQEEINWDELDDLDVLDELDDQDQLINYRYDIGMVSAWIFSQVLVSARTKDKGPRTKN